MSLWNLRYGEISYKSYMNNLDLKNNNIVEITDKILSDFKECFSNFGYIEHPDVQISSKIDKSVWLIGSTISVFKQYLINEKIPDKGYFLIQRCIRTQNLQKITKGEKLDWASYFRSIGTLSPYSRLSEVGMEIWKFFTQYLKISQNNIKIRVSSNDTDLLNIWPTDIFSNTLEIDSKEPKYYKHKYGMENVFGRNLNFAIRQGNTENFQDIGNLIVIEKDNIPIAVELAFGVSTIIARMNCLDNAIQSSAICSVIDYKEKLSYLIDSLAVVIHLMHEGIKPNASNMTGRILRAYIRNVKSYYKEAQYNLDYICKVAEQYELQEYLEKTNIYEKINGYLQD